MSAWSSVVCASELVDCALGGAPEQVLERGEQLFDRVEVGAIGRQEEESGSDLAQGGANRLAFVGAEIVHDGDVARLQGGHEDLFDPCEEGATVDRPADDAWCNDPHAS